MHMPHMMPMHWTLLMIMFNILLIITITLTPQQKLMIKK